MGRRWKSRKRKGEETGRRDEVEGGEGTKRSRKGKERSRRRRKRKEKEKDDKEEESEEREEGRKIIKGSMSRRGEMR